MANQLFTISLALLIGIITANNQDQDFEIKPGFIKRERGQTHFITSYLEIQNDMRCPEKLYRTLEDIIEVNQNILATYLPYLQNRSKGKYYQHKKENKEKKEFIIKKYAPHLQEDYENRFKIGTESSAKLEILEELLQEHQNQFNFLLKDPWLLSHQQSETNITLRNKRGLINLGGNALKFLFGTATMSDIQALSTKVDSLQDSRTHIHKLAEQLHSNTNTLKALKGNLVILSQHLNSSINFMELQQEVSKLHLYANLEKNILDNLQHIISTVQQTWILAKDHITPLNLYTYDILHDILKNNTLFQEQHTTIALTPTSFYQFLTFTWSYLNDQLPYTISTIIPYSDTTPYETFQLIPFPTHVNNTSKRIILQPSYQYYFINFRTLKYTYSHSLTGINCKTSSSVQICFPTGPIQTLKDDNCIISYIMNSITNITCKYSLFPETNPYLVQIGKQTLISLNFSTTASISCLNRTPLLVTASFFNIPHGCNFVSKEYNYQYPTHSTIYSKWKSPNLMIPEHIPNSHDFTPTVPLFNSTLHLDPMPIHWDETLNKLNQTSLNHHIINIHSISLSTATLILFILGAIIFVIFYRKLNSLVRNRLTTTSLSFPMIKAPTAPPVQYTILHRPPEPNPKPTSHTYPSLEPLEAVYSNPDINLVKGNRS